jgi:hypothetical protein
MPKHEHTDAGPLPASSTPHSDLPQSSGTVQFQNVAVRYIRIDSLPWYVAEDVCRAVRLGDEVIARDVADCHKRLASLPGPNGPEELVVMSPIGAWTLTLYRRSNRDQAFQRWVFKETKALQPDGFDRTRYGAAQCMALRPDGDVPTRPHPRSGRADEWLRLKLSRGYRGTGNLSLSRIERAVWASSLLGDDDSGPGAFIQRDRAA